jgi:hypothetical protein
MQKAIAANTAVPNVVYVTWLQAGEIRRAHSLYIGMKQLSAVFNSSLVNSQGRNK